MNNEEIKEARKKYKVLEEKREKLIILKKPKLDTRIGIKFIYVKMSVK